MTDREIDALVAEKVIGWTLDKRLDYGWPVAGSTVPPCKFPAYSTDPAADYSVLCRVRETWDERAQMNFGAELERAWSKKPAPHESTLTCALYEPGDYSRAALAAIGHNTKEP